MESKSTINVTLLSSEIVKPSSPTPLDRKTFTLSFLDQNFPVPIQLPMIFIYANNNCTGHSTLSKEDVITSLKTSLSKTLTVFYPWAGRCDVDNSKILCHDQGVPFNETFVDCSLNDVLESPKKLDLMGKFLPPLDLDALTRQSVSDIAPLSFQVNVFQCGGVIIGCYFFHKVMDVASISTFLQYWAGVASKRYDDLVEPDFAATVAAFPPLVLLEKFSGEDGAGAGDIMAKILLRFNSIKVVCKSFKFDNKTTKLLKAKAVSETVPNPTSFQVVAGFVWQQMMAATSTPTILSFGANIRAKTNPPLPKSAVGNAIATLHVCAGKWDEQLPYYVKQIHATLSTVSEKVKTMQGKEAAETLLEAKESGLQAFHNAKKAPSFAHLSSWSKFGFYDVDFGFGKPTKVILIGNIYPCLRNCINFLDYKDDSNGDGIEVWLFLEEKEMQILEAETKFLEYASSS
ncbi:hypothetical protein KSS87_019358 [Heliosperma pusillum]|nr:hypothetical protein KSS87_019358 [Heliosperma pusillum]